MEKKDKALPVGTMLRAGTYRIERFIASGGFGCTYEARHVMLRKRMAIKEFFVSDYCNRDSATGHVSVGTESMKPLVEKLRGKFVDEARALSGMQHNGIVRVTDVFEDNGTAYYAMDYIEGRSLGQIISGEGRMGEERALRYIRQVCGALEYVHNQNRLHLDIKPGNIMIDKDDNAVLIDFGVSKQYDEESGQNTSTLMGRTPGYAPPEQESNNVRKFFPATDIYAVGATLYTLLTGVTPPPSTLLSSGDEELRPLPAGISRATRRAVTEAMRLRKASRPQSVAAFLSILNDGDRPVPRPEPTPTPTPTPGPTIPITDEKTGRRRKTIVAVAIAFVACVVGAYLIGGNRQADNADKDTDLADGSIAGHEYVDLGLSVKWATCNVGASSPEDYGDYFAWGETETKASYDDDNCETWEKNIGDIGGTSRDVAYVKWGGTWRMPTRDEFEELINNCEYEWTTQDGVEGGKFTSKKNGKSIFLPAAGVRLGASLDGTGEDGGYWSSTPDESGAQGAWGLGFDSGAAAPTGTAVTLGFLFGLLQNEAKRIRFI